jgi:hypothetical protein
MKIKHFLLPISLFASTTQSGSLFFSAGAGMTHNDTCGGTVSSEISAGIIFTDQFSSRITHTDLGDCSFWNDYHDYYNYYDYYDSNYESYSEEVNEITFRLTLPTSGHSSIFFESGLGDFNTSLGYSENTAVIGGGLTMQLRSNWSWDAKLKIYPEKYETIVNLGASLSYNF